MGSHAHAWMAAFGKGVCSGVNLQWCQHGIRGHCECVITIKLQHMHIFDLRLSNQTHSVSSVTDLKIDIYIGPVKFCRR